MNGFSNGICLFSIYTVLRGWAPQYEVNGILMSANGTVCVRNVEKVRLRLWPALPKGNNPLDCKYQIKSLRNIKLILKRHLISDATPNPPLNGECFPWNITLFVTAE